MRRFLIAVVGLMVACYGLPASAFLIDDFTVDMTGGLALNTDASGAPFYPNMYDENFVDGLTTEILGGQRDVILQQTQGADVNDAMSVSVHDDQLWHGSANNAIGYSVLQWDGDDAGWAGITDDGLGGEDLTDGGNMRSLLLRADNRGWESDLYLKVWDMDGDSYEMHQKLQGVTLGQNVYFRYDQFELNGVNMDDVGAIQLRTVQQQAGSDIRYDFVETSTVPEPGSLALMGVLGGIGWIMRRRTKKQ